MPDPKDPSPTAPRGLAGLDANMRAFLALLAPPLSSLAAWRHWGSDRLVRHYAVQGTVFGVAVLVAIAGFKLSAPDPPPAAPTEDSGSGILLFAFLFSLFNLCWVSIWVGQMIGALARRRWFVPVIAPLTRRLLGGGDDRV